METTLPAPVDVERSLRRRRLAADCTAVVQYDCGAVRRSTAGGIKCGVIVGNADSTVTSESRGVSHVALSACAGSCAGRAGRSEFGAFEQLSVNRRKTG